LLLAASPATFADCAVTDHPRPCAGGFNLAGVEPGKMMKFLPRTLRAANGGDTSGNHRLRLRIRSLSRVVTVLVFCLVLLPAVSHAAENEWLIIDTHIDAPFRMHLAGTDPSGPVPTGDFDYPRAVAGGLGTAFMSIFIPSDVDAKGDGLPLAHSLIDRVENLARTHPQKFTLVTCPRDAERAHQRGLLGLAMGMENGGPIGDNLTHLRQLHQRGVRYISLAHGKANVLSDSSYDQERRWKGLSQAGRAVIREMNNLGILVDVSHLSDDAFWHVLDETTVPPIASHSSMRHFIPGFERNMDDRMVNALVARGGVVQINVGSGFLTQRAHAWEETFKPQFTAFKASVPAPDAAATKAFVDAYRARNPYPYATLDDVIDHIDHVVSLAGINGAGIGSDFDGVGDTLPIGLKSVADYPNLIEALRKRGYSRRAIRKVMGGNLLRTWMTVERYASEHGTRPQCSVK
jgi:membrane dipeptidase